MGKSWTFKRRLINYYNNLSESYDQLYGNEQKFKYSLILKILKLQSKCKILDFGCGTGLLLSVLEKEGATFLVGIDISNGMLAKAKEKKTSKTDLILCDGELLPIRDEVFDYVFVITVFQNLYNKKLGLKHTIRVTREGGTIFLSVPDKANYPGELIHYVANEERLIMINKILGSKDLILVLKKL